MPLRSAHAPENKTKATAGPLGSSGSSTSSTPDAPPKTPVTCTASGLVFAATDPGISPWPVAVEETSTSE